MSQNNHCSSCERRAGKALIHLSAAILVLLECFNVQAQSDKPASKEPPRDGHNREEVTPLDRGKPLEREITGRQKHIYQVTLTASQYANITVEQQGIDVLVRLFGVDGALIADFDRE